MITIVDYGAGNIASVRNAIRYLGRRCRIADDSSGIADAERLIVPGVGSFGSMMDQLEERGMLDALKNKILSGTPYLGICLGLQILFRSSEESPGITGLDLIDGRVRRFTSGKIPQIGWNKVVPKDDLFEPGYAYFVNSYYVAPDEDCAAALTDYGGEFVSAIRKDNITAVQFHPEKSGEYGLAFLKRWLSC